MKNLHLLCISFNKQLSCIPFNSSINACHGFIYLPTPYGFLPNMQIFDCSSFIVFQSLYFYNCCFSPLCSLDSIRMRCRFIVLVNDNYISVVRWHQFTLRYIVFNGLVPQGDKGLMDLCHEGTKYQIVKKGSCVANKILQVFRHSSYSLRPCYLLIIILYFDKLCFFKLTLHFLTQHPLQLELRLLTHEGYYFKQKENLNPLIQSWA